MTDGALSGIYPMLYSFFSADGALRPEAFDVQVDAALAADAAGLAVLGLATEVRKLTPDERMDVLNRVSQRLDGRRPLMVTVYGDTPEEQIAFARRAIGSGATALLLQPPGTPLEDAPLKAFFATVLDALDCPVGIQNAPEFLGFGLSPASLTALARAHGNFAVAKLECTAVALEAAKADLGDAVAVFNGRAGLELPDNLRAGAAGLIPGIETVDATTAVYRAFRAGDDERAEALFAAVLPALSFMMQGLPHLLTYGKAVAALRLGLDLGGTRAPALPATGFGMACARRVADRLGPLSH